MSVRLEPSFMLCPSQRMLQSDRARVLKCTGVRAMEISFAYKKPRAVSQPSKAHAWRVGLTVFQRR